MTLVTTDEDEEMIGIHKLWIPITGAALLVSAAGVVLASDDRDDRDDRSAAPALSVAQVAGRLETAGYTNITEIEQERGGYEVEATDPDGARVELRVDGSSGEVLRSELDN